MFNDDKEMCNISHYTITLVTNIFRKNQITYIKKNCNKIIIAIIVIVIDLYCVFEDICKLLGHLQRIFH